MKFRNKETGKVFFGSSDDFCSRTGNCNFCPIASRVDGIISTEVECVDWVQNHPKEAADLMGYELIMEESSQDLSEIKQDSKQGLSDATDAKADSGKPRPTLVPVSLMEAVTAVREYGCAKYHDPENWRQVEPQRYRDALYRHWLAYLRGEKTDPESGLPHLWHLACNAAFLIEMEESHEKEEPAPHPGHPG